MQNSSRVLATSKGRRDFPLAETRLADWPPAGQLSEPGEWGHPSPPLRQAPVFPFRNSQSLPAWTPAALNRVGKDTLWLLPHSAAQTPGHSSPVLSQPLEPLLPGPGPQRPRPFLSPMAPLLAPRLPLSVAAYLGSGHSPSVQPPPMPGPSSLSFSPTPAPRCSSRLCAVGGVGGCLGPPSPPPQLMSGSRSKAEFTLFTPNPPPAVSHLNKRGDSLHPASRVQPGLCSPSPPPSPPANLVQDSGAHRLPCSCLALGTIPPQDPPAASGSQPRPCPPVVSSEHCSRGPF